MDIKKPTYEELEQRVRELEASESGLNSSLEAVQESEKRYRNLFENMIDEVHLWNLVRDEHGEIKTWRLVDVNPAGLKAWGKTRSEIIGKTTDEIFSYNATSHFMHIVEKIFAEGKPHLWESYFPATGQILYMTSIPFGEYFISTGSDITERKKAEEILSESEGKFRHLFDNSPIGKTITYISGEMLSNKALAEMLGYSLNEFRNFKWQEVTHPEDVELSKNIIGSVISGEKEFDRFTKRYIHKNGSIIWADVSTKLQRDSEGTPLYFITAIVDITERKMAEIALTNSNRALIVLKEVNKALLHAENEFTLIQDICRIIVEAGGYSMAWVGYAVKDSTKCVTPIGHWGVSSDYLNKIYITWDDSATGQGPTGRAIRTKTPQIARDITTDNNFDPWRKAALNHGFQSSIALPVCHDQNCLGALNIYAHEQNAFDKSEIDLLGQLADELGFGISSIRKKLEHAKAEKLYNDLVETAHDLIWRCDQQGRYVYLNRAWESILGYSLDEMLGKPFSDFMDSKTAEKDMQLFKALLDEKGFVFEYETVHFRKDGNPIQLLFNAKIYTDEHGEVQGTQGTARDITLHKQTEQALRESREQYRLLFENMIDGFALHQIICDADNHPVDYRFLKVNPAFERLTGLKARSLIGKTVLEVLPKTESFWIAKYGHVALTGEPASFENYSQELDRHYQVTAFRPAKNQFACIFTDVTDRKKYEDQLHQTQKLDAIGTLAGGIAHDFNNLLSVITGNISFGLSLVQSEDELSIVLTDALKGTRQAEKLTHQLLTFAKGGEPIKKSCDVNQLIRETCRFVTSGSKSKCDFHLTNKQLWAEIDSGQIHQVISNIVINSDQAMPNGGIITVGTEPIQIDEGNEFPLAAGRYIKISIEDQGIGIAQKHLFSIFDPYFTTKQKGNGLGLTTAYSIVKRHGGHITAYSEIGKGTVFNIYLPASSSEHLVPEEKEGSTHQGHGRILIMDDQEPILRMVGRMLDKMGYETETVVDGAKAIELYRQTYNAGKPFDLVILDLTVPGGMGGASTLRELVKIDPQVKAIVSSGYSNDPIIANYQDYGFCGVAPKPYTKEQLSEVLNKIFNHIESLTS